jgi:hypothetical protein
MAMPAQMLDLEIPVEERVARLEEKVEHIQSDVSEIKVDLRRLKDRVDGGNMRMTTKIDGLDQRQTSLALIVVERAFAEFRVGRALDRVWWLLMTAALVGVMARGFKWI